MKTVSISVERNFHIMNDDRFIMEKISHTIELESEEDNEHIAMNLAREAIINNFKAAYPKVYTHLNFDEVSQEKTNKNHFGEFNNMVSVKQTTFKVPQEPPNHSHQELEAMNAAEKINKGTIEEQIEASAKLIRKEIESFKLSAKIFKSVYESMVKDNPELQKLYDDKLQQLKDIEKAKEIDSIMEKTEALTKKKKFKSDIF